MINSEESPVIAPSGARCQPVSVAHLRRQVYGELLDRLSRDVVGRYGYSCVPVQAAPQLGGKQRDIGR